MDRFIYLTRGDLGADTTIEMFRRAKLILNRIDESTIRTATDTAQLVARIDHRQRPRCGRVDPPAIRHDAMSQRTKALPQRGPSVRRAGPRSSTTRAAPTGADEAPLNVEARGG